MEGALVVYLFFNTFFLIYFFNYLDKILEDEFLKRRKQEVIVTKQKSRRKDINFK